MKAHSTLLRYMNDSRYILRQRDSIHYKDAEVEFDPVSVDELFADLNSFCATEKRKPLSKQQMIDILCGTPFNGVFVDTEAMRVSGIKMLAESSERNRDGAYKAVPRDKMRMFLKRHAEITGNSRDFVARSVLYDLFTEHNSNPEYSRQCFYKSLLNLTFNTVRTPISTGFAKGGVHCIRGIRLKCEDDEL